MAIDAALGRLGIKSGVCTSSTRPTNPYSGQLIYETDTNRTLVYDNAAWLVVADNQVLSIDSANGRIGVNDTSPSYALDVTGDINATNLRISGTEYKNRLGDGAAVGTFGTFTAGSVLTAAELNAGLPLCVLRSSTQSVPNSTATEFTFGAGNEIRDPYGWHSTATNTERITPDIEGIYLVTFNMKNIAAPVNGRIIFQFKKNGVEYSRVDITSTSYEGITAVAVMYLNGTTDYVTAQIYQTGGATRTFVSPSLSVIWIAA